MKIPSLILRQLYTFGSLENRNGGYRFRLKNRLSDATLVGLAQVEIDGAAISLERIRLDLGRDGVIDATDLSAERPVSFPLRRVVEARIEGESLAEGKHSIAISFDSKPFGRLAFTVEDAISLEKADRVRVPYDKEEDYSSRMIAERRVFAEKFSGAVLDHVVRFTLDPETARGNIENFTGAIQVPLGLAGPLQVNGEHAQGEFLVPLATTEGTLVASYNRGIKVVNLSGGAICTVQDDCMQRAPVFAFETARQARDFRDWVDGHLEEIRDAAEATSSVARLLFIDTYLSNRFAFLRFNYSTGDAAGQNMVGRATFAACSWILERVTHVRSFYLESNLATDKKASQVNIMRTRGKRVTAEVTVPRDVLVQQMRVEPESLVRHHGIGNVGAFLSGANNNGAHSPNAITAMFIATGQDVANVAESSAGILFGEITPDGDLYISLTIPSLIVATYGGGTGLATQRECLELMGCAGKGKVRKFAEIVAGVALAGEISLGAAISSLDWVSSHEKYGRNR